jgi:hypothetical protein
MFATPFPCKSSTLLSNNQSIHSHSHTLCLLKFRPPLSSNNQCIYSFINQYIDPFMSPDPFSFRNVKPFCYQIINACIHLFINPSIHTFMFSKTFSCRNVDPVLLSNNQSIYPSIDPTIHPSIHPYHT